MTEQRDVVAAFREQKLIKENDRLKAIIADMDQAIRDMSIAIGQASEKARIIAGVTINDANRKMQSKEGD